MSAPSLLRDLVATTALRLGPQAPTLCHPWVVQDLMVHLLLRGTRPDILPGQVLGIPALTRHTDRVRAAVADRDFADLVGSVRGGPAPWSPTRWGVLDRVFNTAELAVHHEDMVRAQPVWEPTPMPAPVQSEVWRTVRTAGRLQYRTAPVGVVAVIEGGPGRARAALRRPPSGQGTVVLRGTPLELLLHAFGRTGVCRLRIEGSEADVAALGRHRRAV